jgi:lysophospholipid acyltransferase (LPLAT)-like uncharacterized protein
MSDSRYPAWMRVVAPLGAGLVRLLGATWRLDRTGIAGYDAEIAKGERCIFAFWHSRLLALTFTHRARGVAVLVSRHQDGELITRVIDRLGFVTARGSSTRGGEEGLREMIEWARRDYLLAIAPDGPRGPAEQVKSGLVYLASRTGLPVVPAAAAASPAWRLKSWDGFRIPAPFARVVVAYAPPIMVPPDLDRDALESWRLRVEQSIRTLTRDVDRRVGAGS